MKNFSLLCIFFCLAVQLSGKSGINDLPKSDNTLYSVCEGNEIVVDLEDKSLISEQLQIDIAKVIEFSESECWQNCELWHANCVCGRSFNFQWCPCPWFPPSPEQMGSALCQQACGQQ